MRLALEIDGVTHPLAAYSAVVTEEQGTGAFAGAFVVLTLRSGKRASAIRQDRAALVVLLSNAVQIVLLDFDTGLRLPVAFAPKETDLDRDDSGIVLRFKRLGEWYSSNNSLFSGAGNCLLSFSASASVVVIAPDAVSAPTGGPTAAITALRADAGVLVAAAGSSVWLWNGTGWTSRGSCSGQVDALAVAPSGTIYAGGAWGVSSWTGSAWAAVGSIGAAVSWLQFDAEGYLWAAAGSSEYARRYTGTTWEARGTSLPSIPTRILLGPDGKLYALGGFGVRRAENVGSWSANLGGPSGIVDALFLPDGRLLVAHATGVSVWNGAAWSALSFSSALALAVLPSGVEITGVATVAGLWGKTTRYAFGVLFPGAADIYDRPIARLAALGETVFLGLGGSGTATVYAPKRHTVSIGGSALAAPTLQLTYPSGAAPAVSFFSWEASGGGLYFDRLLIAKGEIVTISGDGVVASSVRGDLSYTLRAGSSPLRLQPGESVVRLNGDVNLSALLSYAPVYLSLDEGEQ